MTKEVYVTRFLTRVVHSGECWLWTGAKSGAGYGGAQWEGMRTSAHRIAWRLFREEPLPAEVDHTCGQRLCVNPAHLTAVESHAAHLARHVEERTRCQRGHEWTEENTYQPRRGNRVCKACNALRQREWQAKRKAKQGIRR